MADKTDISVVVERDGKKIATLDAQVDEKGQMTLVETFGYTPAIPAHEGDVYRAADGRQWTRQEDDAISSAQANGSTGQA